MENKIANDLISFLANNYALYLKLHNYHYNVKGPRFVDLHLLFERQYTELTTAIDDIAERIRQLDVLVPVTFSELNTANSLKDPDMTLKAENMVEDLVTSHNQIIEQAKKILSDAEEANDAATADLITQRLSVLEKNVWMLKSSL